MYNIFAMADVAHVLLQFASTVLKIFQPSSPKEFLPSSRSWLLSSPPPIMIGQLVSAFMIVCGVVSV